MVLRMAIQQDLLLVQHVAGRRDPTGRRVLLELVDAGSVEVCSDPHSVDGEDEGKRDDGSVHCMGSGAAGDVARLSQLAQWPRPGRSARQRRQRSGDRCPPDDAKSAASLPAMGGRRGSQKVPER